MTSPASTIDNPGASAVAPLATGGTRTAGPAIGVIRHRLLLVAAALGIALAAVSGQLVRLAASQLGATRSGSVEALVHTHARPDIVDRNGRLIATDVTGHSLFADPAMLLDADEAAEKIVRALPGLSADDLRRLLRDRSRRFVWIQRGLTPAEAQRVHELGLPGLAFRREPKRAYPAGLLVGHIVGQVDPDNKGVAGLERHLDEVEPRRVRPAGAVAALPVRLTLDLGVQHALADELARAARRFGATGAAGIVLEATGGAILGSYSWPPIDPNVAGAMLDADKPDRVQGGVYELGSILKAVTVAMALEHGNTTLERRYDVSRPLVVGPHRIRDLHPHPGPATVRDIFVRSSNVGAGTIALEAGADRQRAFLERLGLTARMHTEAGRVAPPLLPERWGEIETATIGFGHGVAVAPMQFAAAAASLVNGGHRVEPHYIVGAAASPGSGERLIAERTSDRLREIMRLNVTLPYGTGRRADAPGYRVGGKTGTAEMPGQGGYRKTSVIASFLAAFPMDRPAYVLLVTLFEPQPEGERGGITAGVNAAPVAGEIIQRIAPILGVLPRRIEAAP